MGDLVQGTVLDEQNAAFYTATSLPNDQWAEVTIQALGIDDYVGASVRGAVTGTFYLLVAEGPTGAGAGSLNLVKQVATVQSALTTYTVGAEVNSGVTVNVGSVVRIEAQGSVISGYLDGVLIVQAIDADITSGFAGLFVQAHGAENDATISAFSAGNYQHAVTSVNFTSTFIVSGGNPSVIGTIWFGGREISGSTNIMGTGQRTGTSR